MLKPLRLSTPSSLLLVATLLVAIGALDYATGFQVSMFAAYVAPIALARILLGFGWGFVVVLISTYLRVWTDLVNGQTYDSAWLLSLMILNRFVALLFVLIAFHFMQRTVDLSREKLKAFSGHLQICPKCQRICSHQHEWMSFEAYIRKNSDALPYMKICNDCV